MNLPFAASAEQNKAAILEALRPYLKGDVLEIGSGTGQHAVYFAAEEPRVRWQTSDLEPNLPGIAAWIEDSGLENLPSPIALDVQDVWPKNRYDLVFSANCLHIMCESAVCSCFAGAGACLKGGGLFAVYGPFNYAGRYTSESNARFDAMLKENDPASGIRDFDWLDELAENAGMSLLEDIAMPANNRILIWQKRTL